MINKKPLIIICGYLGSGKTTLLQKLLIQEERKVALIVNDMGSINIDAGLLKKSGNKVEETKMVEMQNGCICCTLRDEFIAQVESLASDPDVEAIFVEASGISEPSSIAGAFVSYCEENRRSPVYLKKIITVVDADRIYREFLGELRADREPDEGDIINLVIDQIEFCNLILMNKTDLLSPEELDEVVKIIRDYQLTAPIIPTVKGDVSLDRIFEGEDFNFLKVQDSSSIQRAISISALEDKEACVDEYGISSFVYEEKRPLNRERFMSFLNDYPKSLIRTKGYIWFSDDRKFVQLFEQAGRNSSIMKMTEWLCAIPKEELDQIVRNYPDIKDDWDEKYGDRTNQLVCIGKGINKREITDRINACLDD